MIQQEDLDTSSEVILEELGGFTMKRDDHNKGSKNFSVYSKRVNS